MKTLIFPSEFIDNKGGVPQTTISIVKGLNHCPNLNIVVVCPRNSEMAMTQFPNNVIVCTTRSIVWTMSKRNIFRTLGTIVDLYKVIRPFLNEDTWVVTNQPVTSSLISLLPCKHIKEIYINRGGDFMDGGFASRIIQNKLKHGIIEYAVGISKRQCNLLAKYGMPTDRIFLIHNGLPKPSVNYEYKRLSKENLKISTIGYISDLKNQIEGVKLVKMLRYAGINASLNLYGVPDSDKEYQIKIHCLIKDLELDSYINFCGFVSGEELFADTDILISFSRSEGFGRSLVEGMLRKKPIIAWRGAGGPVDITNNGLCGHLVDNNNASDYFDVVTNLLNDPLRNKQNVEDSFNFASRHFTVDCMVDNYVQLFKDNCIL